MCERLYIGGEQIDNDGFQKKKKDQNKCGSFFKISKANIHANCKFELWEEEYFLRIFFYLKILRKGILNDQCTITGSMMPTLDNLQLSL